MLSVVAAGVVTIGMGLAAVANAHLYESLDLHVALLRIEAGIDASLEDGLGLAVAIVLAIVRHATLVDAGVAVLVSGHLADCGIFAGLEAVIADAIGLVVALLVTRRRRLLATLGDALAEELLSLLIAHLGSLTSI